MHLFKVKKLYNLVSCNYDNDCGGGQYCRYSSVAGDKVCDCSNDRWWNQNTLYCGE